jgi:hypothetical protein
LRDFKHHSRQTTPRQTLSKPPKKARRRMGETQAELQMFGELFKKETWVSPIQRLLGNFDGS